VIRDGERVVAESAAILEYVVEQHGNGALIPARGTPSYERYRYWMHYAEGSLMTPFLLKLYLGRVGEPARALLERIEGQLRTHLSFVEDQLGDAQYLVGSELTIADIQMSFPLELADTQKLLEGSLPRLKQWVTRMHARPAYRRALEKGGPYAFAND
jgi:glutathione S-transferase